MPSSDDQKKSDDNVETKLIEIIICPGFNTIKKFRGTKPTSLKLKIAKIYKNINFWKAVSEN